MVVLPVEPEVFQGIDSSQALSLPVARHGTSIKAPITERIRIQKDPGISGIFPSAAVEVESVGPQLAGESTYGFSIRAKYQHDRVTAYLIQQHRGLNAQLAHWIRACG